MLLYPLSLCLIVTIAVAIRAVFQEWRGRQSHRCQRVLVQAIRRAEY